jgi:hypothetical protein
VVNKSGRTDVISLQTNGPTVGAYLGGNVLPELIPDARVRILKAKIGSRDIVIYASDTKSKQIGLFFYDALNGEFISSRYLGFSNPFEIAALIQTEGDGLAVCGTTWLAGRFRRANYRSRWNNIPPLRKSKCLTPETHVSSTPTLILSTFFMTFGRN